MLLAFNFIPLMLSLMLLTSKYVMKVLFEVLNMYKNINTRTKMDFISRKQMENPDLNQ